LNRWVKNQIEIQIFNGESYITWILSIDAPLMDFAFKSGLKIITVLFDPNIGMFCSTQSLFDAHRDS
jgi:hypothetical protein